MYLGFCILSTGIMQGFIPFLGQPRQEPIKKKKNYIKKQPTGFCQLAVKEENR
jgi:hypothetical protein